MSKTLEIDLQRLALVAAAGLLYLTYANESATRSYARRTARAAEDIRDEVAPRPMAGRYPEPRTPTTAEDTEDATDA